MHRTRRAFSLLELVVVICILGLLIGLLLPAIQSAREHARQAQCASNQRNLSMGILQYTMRRERLPGWAVTWKRNDGTAENTGWVPQIFEEIDQKELKRFLREGSVANGQKKYQRDLPILHCASDPADYEAPLWSAAAAAQGGCGGPAPPNATKSKCPTSYAVNAGRPDAAAEPPDDARFALFHDHRDGRTKVVVGMEDVTDGLAHTLLLTENIDLVDWTQVTEAGQGVVFYGKWDDDKRTWTDVPVPVAFNDLRSLITPVDCNLDGVVDNLDVPHARPSSYHTQGVNMAYADGHVEYFFADPADPKFYGIYRSKLTPGAGD